MGREIENANAVGVIVHVGVLVVKRSVVHFLIKIRKATVSEIKYKQMAIILPTGTWAFT